MSQATLRSLASSTSTRSGLWRRWQNAWACPRSTPIRPHTTQSSCGRIGFLFPVSQGGDVCRRAAWLRWLWLQTLWHLKPNQRLCLGSRLHTALCRWALDADVALTVLGTRRRGRCAGGGPGSSRAPRRGPSTRAGENASARHPGTHARSGWNDPNAKVDKAA